MIVQGPKLHPEQILKLCHIALWVVLVYLCLGKQKKRVECYFFVSFKNVFKCEDMLKIKIMNSVLFLPFTILFQSKCE